MGGGTLDQTDCVHQVCTLQLCTSGRPSSTESQLYKPTSRRIGDLSTADNAGTGCVAIE